MAENFPDARDAYISSGWLKHAKKKKKKHELLGPMTESVPTEKNINNKVRLYFQASKSKSVTEA